MSCVISISPKKHVLTIMACNVLVTNVHHCNNISILWFIANNIRVYICAYMHTHKTDKNYVVICYDCPFHMAILSNCLNFIAVVVTSEFWSTRMSQASLSYVCVYTQSVEILRYLNQSSWKERKYSRENKIVCQRCTLIINVEWNYIGFRMLVPLEKCIGGFSIIYNPHGLGFLI